MSRKSTKLKRGGLYRFRNLLLAKTIGRMIRNGQLPPMPKGIKITWSPGRPPWELR